jgi:hypothetical protein
MDTKPDDSILWNSATEGLIKSLGEKALSLSWLHNRSEIRYNYLNNFLAIPAIIISTITGVGTAGLGTTDLVKWITASLSIMVSVISTLNSYFSFAKRAEAHRITAINYSKLYLMISIELSLPRMKRMGVKSFLKVVSEQVQRLNEIQPTVPDAIIKEYNIKFKDEPSSIAKPEITNGLVELQVYINEPTPTPSPSAEPETKPEVIVHVTGPTEKPKRTPFK